jgi:hypothetical protein
VRIGAVVTVATGLQMASVFKQCEPLMSLSAGVIPEATEPAAARRLHSMVRHRVSTPVSGPGGTSAGDVHARDFCTASAEPAATVPSARSK